MLQGCRMGGMEKRMERRMEGDGGWRGAVPPPDEGWAGRGCCCCPACGGFAEGLQRPTGMGLGGDIATLGRAAFPRRLIHCFQLLPDPLLD